MNKKNALLLLVAFLLAIPALNNHAAASYLKTGISISPAPLLIQAQLDGGGTESAGEKIQQIQNLISFSVILLSIVILLITYFLVRLLVALIDILAKRSSKYRLTIKSLGPVIQIFFWSIALYIIIAGIINPSLETIIVVTAAIGIAVALASQEILKNIFGGFMLIFDRTFQVGDKIRVGDHYGEVIQIGLRSTRIKTPDDSVVILPNGNVISNAVSNEKSGTPDCQVVAKVFLPARVNISQAKQIAYKAAISSPYAYLKKPVVIIANSEVQEGNFVVKLRIKAHVMDIGFEFPFQSDMTEQILTEYNRRSLIPVSGKNRLTSN